MTALHSLVRLRLANKIGCTSWPMTQMPVKMSPWNHQLRFFVSEEGFHREATRFTYYIDHAIQRASSEPPFVN